MPKAVSRKQYRMMMAILHSGPKGDRQPPASIAAKYSKHDKDAPESKNNDRGGKWRNKDKKKKQKSKEEVKKSFEEFYAGRGAGVIITNEAGEILVGKDENGEYSFPGGHVELGETWEEGAKREAKEEANIAVEEMKELGMYRYGCNDSKAFFATKWSGTPKANDGEMKGLEWRAPNLLIDQKIRPCCAESLRLYLKSSFKKCEDGLDDLYKNILRDGAGAPVKFDISHGDALKLVGTGLFRLVREHTRDMQDEDFRTFNIDSYIINIRKHSNDIYSGRVQEGQKMIHQFINKSLPMVVADLMSLFEWYDEKDGHVIDQLIDENVDDEVVHGGLHTLSDNYHKHNLANIYKEFETIRTEIRHNNSIDIQQVEMRIMKLFDKLEDSVNTLNTKHNEMCNIADREISDLEMKLKELQQRVAELQKPSSTVEAFSPYRVNPDKVYNNEYFYLPRPQVIIEPNGRIRITFGEQWSDLDKENFLSDMKAKVMKPKGK